MADGGAVFGRLSWLRAGCLGDGRGGVGVGGRVASEQMTASELVSQLDWDNEDSSDVEDDDGRLQYESCWIGPLGGTSGTTSRLDMRGRVRVNSISESRRRLPQNRDDHDDDKGGWDKLRGCTTLSTYVSMDNVDNQPSETPLSN